MDDFGMRNADFGFRNGDLASVFEFFSTQLLNLDIKLPTTHQFRNPHSEIIHHSK